MTQGRLSSQVRGVSLLEVLVALVILGTSAAVLFEWVLQLNTRLRSIQEQQAVAAAQLRSIEFLNGINPAVRRSGSQRFLDAELRWQTMRATPFRNMLLPSGAPADYAVAVFDVKAQIYRAQVPGNNSAEPWVRFDTRLAGWRPVRSNSLPWFATEVDAGGGAADPGTQQADGTEELGNPSAGPRGASR